MFCILSGSPIFLVGCSIFQNEVDKRQEVPSLIDPSPPHRLCALRLPIPSCQSQRSMLPKHNPLTFPNLQAHRWEHPTHPLRWGTCHLLCEAFPASEEGTQAASGLPENSPDLCNIHYSALWLLLDLKVSPRPPCANLRGACASVPLTVINQLRSGPDTCRGLDVYWLFVGWVKLQKRVQKSSISDRLWPHLDP